MASKKKTDGGAARADARRRSQNMRTAKKMGLKPGVATQFENYKSQSSWGTKTEQAALLLSGGAVKLPASVSNSIGKAASKIGKEIGDDVLAKALSKIKPGSAAPKIKNLKGTVITPLGGGKGGLYVQPPRTPAQIRGAMQSQATRAANQADQIAALTSSAAKKGIIKGGKVGLGGTAAGLAAGYAKGRYDGSKNKNPKSLDTPNNSIKAAMKTRAPYSPGVAPSYPKKPYVAPLPEKTRNESAPAKKAAPVKKAAPKKKGKGMNVPVWKF